MCAKATRSVVGGLQAHVWETPGHCVDHVSYWFAADRALFAGDTLFTLGCGRMFEGTYAEFWASLQRLAALPDEARVYCGHDYTLSNARFALAADPDNEALKARAAEAEKAKAARPLPRAVDHRAGEGDQSLPACGRACARESGSKRKREAGRGLSGLARMEEQVLIRETILPERTAL